MICSTCLGRGFLRQRKEWIGYVMQLLLSNRVNVHEVCHDCGGTGFAHCCEGMIANRDWSDDV